MHRLAYLALLVSAACHPDKAAPAGPGNAATGAVPAAPAGPLDCGIVDTRTDAAPPNAQAAYQCFADAFHASREATVQWLAVTDEGGTIYTTYRVVPAEGATPLVTLTIDDRDDGFSADRGVHELICTSLAVERTTSGGLVLRPEGCTGGL